MLNLSTSQDPGTLGTARTQHGVNHGEKRYEPQHCPFHKQQLLKMQDTVQKAVQAPKTWQLKSCIQGLPLVPTIPTIPVVGMMHPTTMKESLSFTVCKAKHVRLILGESPGSEIIGACICSLHPPSTCPQTWSRESQCRHGEIATRLHLSYVLDPRKFKS